MQSRKVLHLVTYDKFATAYINFMKICMSEYENVFLLSWDKCYEGNGIEGNLVDDNNIVRFKMGKELAFGGAIRKLIKEADKIIVTGIFGVEFWIYFWPQWAWKKIYLQYWGGEFYQLRTKKSAGDWKEMIHRRILLDCFKRSKGAIFLIDGEYEKYKEITGIIKKEVYIAPVPSDPNREFPFYKYVMPNKHSVVRIVVGNSATEENMHTEALKKLAQFSDKNIEVFCPLSYGDREYGEKISAYGKKMFGNKFHPIFDWMEKNEYYSFLATCDIGIFANNRQQAMGNISALLRMGRKVYLRKDTSMYKNYMKIGCLCYDIACLSEMSYDEFLSNPQYEQTAQKLNEWYSIGRIKKQWDKVFEA